MTTYALMTNESSLGGDPLEVITPIMVAGNPTRARYTLTLNGPSTAFCQATVLASVDLVNYVPLVVMKIEAYNTTNTVSFENRESGNYIAYDAQLDNIAPGGNTASVTMVV